MSQVISTAKGKYHKQSDNWLTSGRTKCGIKLNYLYIEKLENVLNPKWRWTRKRKINLCKRCFKDYLSVVSKSVYQLKGL